MQAFSTWNNNGESIRESLDRANKIMESMKGRPTIPDKLFVTDAAWAKIEPRNVKQLERLKGDIHELAVAGLQMRLRLDGGFWIRGESEKRLRDVQDRNFF